MTTIEVVELPLNAVPSAPGNYESLWLLMRRLMLANDLRPHELQNVFPTRSQLSRHRRCSDVYCRFDLAAMAPYLGHSAQSIARIVPRALEIGGRAASLSPVRLCPACAEVGYHSALHEVRWLKDCPLHLRPLIHRCLQCNAWLGHTSLMRLGETPYTLHCGHAWTQADIRRPPDISAVPNGNLIRWLRRFGGARHGERWYLLALGSEHSRRVGGYDHYAVVRRLLGIGGYSSRVHKSRSRSPDRLTCQPLTCGAQGFDAMLERFAHLSCRDAYENGRFDLQHLWRELRSMLSSYGQKRLCEVLRRHLHATDFTTGRKAVLELDEQALAMVTAAFLQNLFDARRAFGIDESDTLLTLRRMVTIAPEPLGLLCQTSEQTTIYYFYTQRV